MCVKPHAALFTESFQPGRKWDIEFIDRAYQDEIGSFMDRLVASSLSNGVKAKWSMIPCGQCHECRLQRSREWANRCVMEMDAFKPVDGINRNWFVTMTYSPDHVDELRSTVDGCTLSLHQPESGKDHLQKFNNAVRKKWDEKYGHQGIRFYACGEYGDESGRPHYHEILFNLPIDPSLLKVHFTNDFGDKYYVCDELFRSWGSKGHVLLSEANWTNCAYVARYIMKKLNGDLGVDKYDKFGIKAPFTRQSRMPGIGASFYKNVCDYFDTSALQYFVDPENGELISDDLDDVLSSGACDVTDKLYLPGANDKLSPICKPPRYFDRLFERQYPKSYEYIKQHRDEVLRKAQAQAKVQYPISDRELFSLREDAWYKQQIGNHRDFIKNL